MNLDLLIASAELCTRCAAYFFRRRWLQRRKRFAEASQDPNELYLMATPGTGTVIHGQPLSRRLHARVSCPQARPGWIAHSGNSLSIRLSVSMFVYPYICLSVCPSDRPSIHPLLSLSWNLVTRIILILITAVLYSAPSRKSTQERSQSNLGQTMWS